MDPLISVMFSISASIFTSIFVFEAVYRGKIIRRNVEFIQKLNSTANKIKQYVDEYKRARLDLLKTKKDLENLELKKVQVTKFTLDEKHVLLLSQIEQLLERIDDVAGELKEENLSPEDMVAFRMAFQRHQKNLSELITNITQLKDVILHYLTFIGYESLPKEELIEEAEEEKNEG